ncbi:MAG: tryptophan dimethylallyltransferase family protein [Myxococcota bacterium]
MLSVQSVLLEPWGEYDVPEQPLFPSQIGDDHSPYEYSLAFDASGVELRILCEAQSTFPAYASNLEAALACNERLRRSFGVDLSRLELIADLFLPAESDASFGLWHATCLTASGSPEFKVYVNPAVRGKQHSWDVVTEAMARLGFSAPSMALLKRAAFRSDEDELKYFSVDLSSGPRARAKVYLAHHHARVSDLEKAFAVAPSHRSGDVREFCTSLLGDQGPFSQKPLTSCFSFVAGNATPSAVTLHAPVAHYVEDDELIAERLHRYLTQHGLAADVYGRALVSLAQRGLSEGPGIQSYASIRRLPSGMRTTVYLSPCLFDDGVSRSRVSRRIV